MRSHWLMWAPRDPSDRRDRRSQWSILPLLTDISLPINMRPWITWEGGRCSSRRRLSLSTRQTENWKHMRRCNNRYNSSWLDSMQSTKLRSIHSRRSCKLMRPRLVRVWTKTRRSSMKQERITQLRSTSTLTCPVTEPNFSRRMTGSTCLENGQALTTLNSLWLKSFTL